MRMTAAFRAPTRPPFLQVAKSAVAVIAAWLLCRWLIPGPQPVFGAIAALLVVQPSLNQSFGKGVERTVGVIVGVAVAAALGVVLGNGTVVVLVAATCAILIAWMLRMTAGTANQVAISALLVLALGTATPNYAIDRVLETIIGAIVGFVVNIVLVPPVALAPAHRAVVDLGSALADGLDRLAGACTAPASTTELDRMLDDARAIRPKLAAAGDRLTAASESLTLNPRARGHREEVARLQGFVDRLSPVVTQTVGMTRAVQELYDPSIVAEPTMRDIAEQLRRAAHDVRLMTGRVASGADAVTGAVGQDEPALTTPIAIGTPSPAHWALIGSLLTDLRRIHLALAEAD